MSPVIVFLLLCHLTYTIHAASNHRRLQALASVGVQNISKKEEADPPDLKNDRAVVINVKSDKSKANSDGSKDLAATTIQPVIAKNDTNLTTSTDHKKFKPAEMESGALLRGVLVIVALSVLIIIYMAVKTYYGKRNKPAMVRKYGVRTRRSDIEMTPLPLEEDEEDETLFEVGNTNR